MFEGLLDENSDIYVTTAANALESSWATYCPDFFTNQQGGAASSRAAASNSLVGAVSLVNTRVTASEEDYLLEVAEGIVAAGVEAQQQQQQQGGSGQRGLLQWMLPGGWGGWANGTAGWAGGHSSQWGWGGKREGCY
jgi:hypothetical protein